MDHLSLPVIATFLIVIVVFHSGYEDIVKTCQLEMVEISIVEVRFLLCY